MSKPANKKQKKESATGATPFGHWYKTHLLIFLSAIAVYFNSIPNSYNLDDEIVTRNHRLTSKGISAIPQIFTEPYYKDASGYSYEYRPMVLVSFAIEHSLLGENAHASHFINVLLYAWLCVLLFVVLKLLFKDYGSLLAFVATAFFVVHPAHTEVVDSIKNRDEILALGGALAAMFFALRWADSGKWYFIPVSAFCFVLAVLSKQSVIAWAVVIPMALVFFRHPPVFQLLLLTFLLLLPVVWFSLLQMLNMRVAVLVAGLLAVTFLWVWLQRLSSLEKLRWLGLVCLQKVKGLVSPKRVAGHAESNTEFHEDKSTLTPVFWVVSSVLSITVFAVAFYCIASGYTYPLMALTICFTLLSFTLNDAFKKVLFLPSFVLVLITVYAVGVNAGFYIMVYLIAATVYYLYYGGGFRYAAVPVAVIGFAIQIFVEHNYFLPIAEVLPVVFLLKRKFYTALRVVGVGALVVGLMGPITSALEGSIMYDDQARFLLVALMLYATFKPAAVKWYSYCIPAALIFNLAFIGLLLNKQTSVYYTSVQTASVVNLRANLPFVGGVAESVRTGQRTAVAISNTEITDSTTQRPLSFIEAPVTHDSSQSVRIGTALTSVSYGLHKVVLPYPMSFYYGYRFIKPTGVMEFRPVAALVVCFVLFVLSVLLVNRNRLLSFSLLLFLISISVYSNYFYPLPGSIAERFLFIPSISWCLVLTYLIFWLTKTDFKEQAENFRAVPRVASGVIVAVLLLYSGITFARNFQWKDHITLFRHDIDYVSESAQAHNLLGVQLVVYSEKMPTSPEQFKMREEAIPHFKKAIEIYPGFMNPVYDLARVYTMINQPDSALTYFKKSAVMSPEFYESHLACAEILARAGKWNEAIPYLEHITQNYPTESRSYDLLSLIYFQLKNYEASVAVNKKAMQILPNAPNPPQNIGRVFEVGYNNVDSAVYYYKIALQLNPRDVPLQQAVQMLSRK